MTENGNEGHQWCGRGLKDGCGERRCTVGHREEENTTKAKKTLDELASQNVKPIRCFPEALTRQNVETQPSLVEHWSQNGQITGLSMIVFSNFIWFW